MVDRFRGTWMHRALAAAAVIFLISCFLSWQELGYLTRARKAEATILRVSKTSRHLWWLPVWEPILNRPVQVADYEFADREGFHRKREAIFPLDWTPPANGKLMIEYLPGRFAGARPLGEHDYIAPVVLIMSLGAGALVIVKSYREAAEGSGRAVKNRA
jgi:hypothetical protein